MKRILAILLALMLLASLAACNTDTPNTTETPGNTGTEGTDSGEDTSEAYSFKLNGVELVPGADFKPSTLPEAAFVYEVPSCAIEGTDNVYNYETIEITAFDDGSGEIIYSIYVIDANTPTPEGLYLGDDLTVVNTLYGTDCTKNENELVYRKGKTMLILILENDCVVSIEYRAITD